MVLLDMAPCRVPVPDRDGSSCTALGGRPRAGPPLLDRKPGGSGGSRCRAGKISGRSRNYPPPGGPGREASCQAEMPQTLQDPVPVLRRCTPFAPPASGIAAWRRRECAAKGLRATAARTTTGRFRCGGCKPSRASALPDRAPRRDPPVHCRARVQGASKRVCRR